VDGITESGKVYPANKLLQTPAAKIVLAHHQVGQVVWFTDLPHIVPLNRHLVGLSRDTATNCDRTAYRFRALSAETVRPWTEVRGNWPPEQVAVLEELAGCQPAHWLVSGVAVPVLLDQHRTS
jgi:hypothetical protein